MVFTTRNTSEESIITKSYCEINSIADTNGSIVVVPLGSLEQHGYHLPVGTDTLLAKSVAMDGVKIASENDDVPILVTPTLWFGYSPEHIVFGGTLSSRFQSLIATLENMVEAASQIGFDALVFLNGHGGNIAPLEGAIRISGKKYDLEVAGVTYFHLAKNTIEFIRESQPGGMFHGGELETSLMLYLYPEFVDEDAISGTKMDAPYEEYSSDITSDGSLLTYRDYSSFSESGSIGAPELASSKKGEQLYESFVSEIADILDEINNTVQ